MALFDFGKRLKPGDELTAELVNKIIDAINSLANVSGGAGVVVRRSKGGLQITGQRQAGFYAGVANGDITARSGTTPGTGQVDLIWVDPSGPTLTPIGVTVDVYYLEDETLSSGNGIDDGMYVYVEQDAFDAWHVSPAECGGA